nr:asparaginase [bacterium]
MTGAGFRLGMVQTGGTIGCTWTDGGVAVLSDSATVGPVDVRRLWRAGPELTVVSRAPINRASEDLVPADWLAMTGAVRQLATEGAQAVVVLHGTDTAAYTCAAMSFLLNSIDIPVIVTGASLPPDHPASDAAANLEAALIAARHAPAGVHLVFRTPRTGAGELHLGTRVRKTGEPGQPFVTVGGSPIARMTTAAGYESLTRAPHPFATPTVAAVEPSVLSLRCHPGLDFLGLRTLISASDVRGVVLELYASGTGPARPGRTSLPDFAVWCRTAGVPVVSALWHADGAPARYESTVALEDAEVLFLPTILPEVATVKLMWALAQPHGDPLELMRTPVRGEFGPVEPIPAQDQPTAAAGSGLAGSSEGGVSPGVASRTAASLP